jgi:hypothetical protein
MPKINQAGATYYGQEGLVTNGDGVISQLDPSRNADGTVVDGYESDERELEDRDGTPGDKREPGVVEGNEPVVQPAREREPEPQSEDEKSEDEKSEDGKGNEPGSLHKTENEGSDSVSRGNSSGASQSGSAKTSSSKPSRR